MTWLSILMPTYRGERYVAQALESVAVQSDDDIELLVVDDGSDDRTLDIVRRFESRIPIRILEGARRKNWVASTNLALRAASGEFACMLHQDDGWAPTRIARVRAAFAAHPEATWLVHASSFVDSHGARVGAWNLPFDRTTVRVGPGTFVERLLVQNFLAIPAPVFRTRDALAIGGLDESLWYTADWDLWLGLAARGEALLLGDELTWFRIHGESQTITRSGDAASLREQMTRVLERHLARAELAPLDRDEVRRAARLAIEVNVALASLAHGRPPSMRELASAIAAGRVRGSRRMLRDSRIVDRVTARLRAAVRGRMT